jgi:O-antigen ligase
MRHFTNPLFLYDQLYPVVMLLTSLLFLVIHTYGSNKRIIQINITQVDVLVGLFFLYIAINKAHTRPTALLFSDFQLQMLFLLTYISVRIGCSGSFNHIKPIGYFIAIITFSELLIGLLQLTGILENNKSAFKVTGSQVNPSIFANYLVTSFPIVFYLLYGPKKLYRVMRYLLCAGMFIVIFAGMNVRGAWMASLLIAGLIIFFGRRNIYATVFKSTLAKVSFILLSAGVLTWLLFFKADSTSGRWFIFSNALSLLQQHFFGGIGIGNFDVYYNNYQEHFFRTHSGSRYELLAFYGSTAFNEYIQWWLEGGIIALLLMLVCLCKFMLIVRKADSYARHPMFKGALISCITFLFISLFSFPFSLNWVIGNLLLSLAVLSYFDDKIIYIIKPRAFVAAGILAICAALLVFKIFYDINDKIKWANAQKMSAKTNLSPDMIRGVDSTYHYLYPTLKNNAAFLVNYASFLYQRNEYHKTIAVLSRAKDLTCSYELYLMLGRSYEYTGNINAAEHAYEKCCYMVPLLYTARYRLMLLYLKEGKLGSAKYWAGIIKAMPIKIASPEVDQIKKRADEIITQ